MLVGLLLFGPHCQVATSRQQDGKDATGCISASAILPTTPQDKTLPELVGTAFPKCQCRSGMHILCVHHALLQVVVQLRKEGRWTPTTHVFTSRSGEIATRHQVIMLARARAYVLQQEQIDSWGPEAVARWSLHVFHAAGTQMFARSMLDMPYIQLVGRCGSSVVLAMFKKQASCYPKKQHGCARWFSVVALFFPGPACPISVLQQQSPGLDPHSC